MNFVELRDEQWGSIEPSLRPKAKLASERAQYEMRKKTVASVNDL
jgi:hypothetical protein